jgi:hypothetical protein
MKTRLLKNLTLRKGLVALVLVTTALGGTMVYAQAAMHISVASWFRVTSIGVSAFGSSPGTKRSGRGCTGPKCS